ncbi:LysR family transcriptional regulator (plasmid) [Rhizobium sp. BG4]|nr:LysR family transcriptional regulator [Rhizobium sp. BG4]
MLHTMNISMFDLNRIKALHFLLEEAHVGRAAARLNITPAATSNALRRLREDLGDPLLVKRGRGLVRTRIAEDLRAPARDVVACAELLLRTARPFEARGFAGELPVSLSEHVAAILLPHLDRLVRERAPLAKLTVAAIPLDVADWLKKSGGILVGPSGPFAATMEGDNLLSEDYYLDRYVCVARRDHRLVKMRWSPRAYADQSHVLVVPRGRSTRSDVDDALIEHGLFRQIARTVPSFQMAIQIISQSDLVTTMPERNTFLLPAELITRKMPFDTPPLPMRLIFHPAYREDGRTTFIKTLLRDALALFDAAAA